MELLYWKPITRKRARTLSYQDPDFVLGYDIDVSDFTALVEKFNQNTLEYAEEHRLYDHIRTMINIVMENPSINPKGSEKAECADIMFVDAWQAMRYIKPGKSPYSYIYRSAYTAACRYFKKKIAERKKEEAIQNHLWECFRDYQEAQSDGRVYNVNVD